MSEIADYGLMHEVLHFHYDLWLWQTVSGAVSQGKKMKCSPNKSLENKTFSTEYWRWQHRYLMDAVNQFGHPDLFITISPFEWTFPQPPWLQKLREETGHGPTCLSGFETIHIVHVLEQVVRGYLTGCNCNRWSTQVFNYDYKKDKKNVKTYFYRFEFQDRGTVHLHMLVWLTDMTKVKVNVFRADVPWNNADLAYLVSDLQKSNSSVLPLKTTATEVGTEQAKSTLSFYHPEDAFELNLRAYISTLLPSLKCRMDVQSSDEKGMILKYVASYVSKWHDAYSNDALFSLHVGPYQAAYRHLRALRPLEPEMWMSLSSQKIAWTNSTTKSITVPTREAEATKVYKAYLNRPNSQERLTFLIWLRKYDGQKTPPKLYKPGSTTLVGAKMRSVFADEFFHQYNVLYIPHRKPEDLYHPDDDSLPVPIKCFAAAWLLSPDLWNSSDKVAEYFSLHGNKEEYVMNVVQHVRSRIDFIHLWQRRVVGAIGQYQQELQQLMELNPEQHTILRMTRQAMEDRKQCYENVPEGEGQDLLDSDSYDDVLQEDEHEAARNRSLAQNWKRFILINGKPGTGKTHTVCKAISAALQQDYNVKVAAPTGFLASTYRGRFSEDNFSADMIHGLFKYPVDPTERSQINWELVNADLLVIDEISMVPIKIFQHIMNTVQQLYIRPVVLLCGDSQQQQPIETVDGKIQPAKSILEHKHFYSICNRINFVTQHRCEDPGYAEILDTLRYYKPNQRLLDRLEHNRIIFD